jgi:hypothetical protein
LPAREVFFGSFFALCFPVVHLFDLAAIVFCYVGAGKTFPAMREAGGEDSESARPKAVHRGGSENG